MRSLGLVLPLYNAAHFLPRVLPPIVEAFRRGELREAIVVDDSSSDEGARICREAGLRVLPSGGRRGPGACRNLGVQAAATDLVLFIDSDVVMHEDVPARVLAAFDAVPGLVAVFGSYDDRPAARTVLSLYKNLLHHFVHHQGRAEAETFWAGCGAIDRRAFLEAGGFDERRYPHPSIEDIELGYRLRKRGGRILLAREMQGTHLKRWTLRELLRTDILRRALPWGRLLMEPGYGVNDLNVSTAEKLKVPLAALVYGALLAIPVSAAAVPTAAVAIGAALLANRRFFALVLRRGGLLAMIGAFFFHQLYYLYSAAAYVYCRLEHRFARRAGGAP